MPKCDSSSECDHSYYCDTTLGYCDHCRNICHPAIGLRNTCLQKCPNYPGTGTTKPSLIVTTAIATTKTLISENTTSTSLDPNNKFVYILIAVLFLLVLVVIILIIILFRKFNIYNQLPNIQPALKDCCCSGICCYKCEKENKQRDINEAIPLQELGAVNDFSIENSSQRKPMQPVQQETLESCELVPSQSNSNLPCTSKRNINEYHDNGKTNSIREQSKESHDYKSEASQIPLKLASVTENNTVKEQNINLTEQLGRTSEMQVKPKRTLSQNIQTQTDPDISHQERPLSTTIETQTEEPYFDIAMYSSVFVPKLTDEPVQILRPKTEQNRSPAVINEKQMEEAVKSIVVKPEYQNDRDIFNTVLSETIDTRDPPELEPENGTDDQTDLKAVGGLTIPQQETTPMIPDSGAGAIPKPQRRIHPNKRIYEILKGIHWVQGYYSEGRSIEVYVDFEDILPERALQELVRRTGERPEKFRVLQNEPVQYQSMKFAAII